MLRPCLWGASLLGHLEDELLVLGIAAHLRDERGQDLHETVDNNQYFFLYIYFALVRFRVAKLFAFEVKCHS